MKIKDIIDRVGRWSGDELMPEEEYIRLINEVDKKLYDNIIKNHETDMTLTVHEGAEDDVLIPEEYGDVYVHYILSQAMLRRYETERATNHMAIFNDLYSRYSNYITREFMPRQRAKITL